MTRSRQTADWGSRAGLAKVIPSSVAVGSGTGSADTTGTVTFTTVSSVSLNNCFSSTYDNYKIIINLTAMSAANHDILLRLRANGSDTSANYTTQRNYRENTTSNNDLNVAGTDEFWIGYGSSTYATQTSIQLDIFNPQTNIATKIKGGNGYRVSTGTFYLADYAGVQSDTTQFDGFTFYPGSGTITGKITVYGFN